MNLYDIIEDLIGFTTNTSGTVYNNNTTILQICGLIIILLIIWFLDCLYRLFFRAR